MCAWTDKIRDEGHFTMPGVGLWSVMRIQGFQVDDCSQRK